MKKIFVKQYERWWNVKVQPCTSKEHFLRYAGRYVRRPPIAQYRFVVSPEGMVMFRTKDHKLRRGVITQYTEIDFITALSDQVPDHYRHAIRHFGLLAPRSKNQTSDAIFCDAGSEPPAEATAPVLGLLYRKIFRDQSSRGFPRSAYAPHRSEETRGKSRRIK